MGTKHLLQLPAPRMLIRKNKLQIKDTLVKLSVKFWRIRFIRWETGEKHIFSNAKIF